MNNEKINIIKNNTEKQNTEKQNTEKMNLDNLLKRVAVLGAAGKMGSGIALLLLQEMARVELSITKTVGSGAYQLYLIDTSEQGLFNLRKNLHQEIIRHAEKNINLLRKLYADNPTLVSNGEIIDAYVAGTLSLVRLEESASAVRHASLVFEAIVEDVAIKSEVLSHVNDKAFVFSNTSSIPIQLLAKKSHLENRLIGFHFYNPPPVQRLLEVIPLDSVNPVNSSKQGNATTNTQSPTELTALAIELAKRLGKIVVFSKDVAGFIGNGHFLREIDEAFSLVKQLQKEGYSQAEAITIVDKVTREFMVRPMGMFQLLDYVGIGVCQKIMEIMEKELGIKFDRSLLQGVTSFYHYDGGRPIAVYSEKTKEYIPIPEVNIGALPSGYVPWKVLHKVKDRDSVMSTVDGYMESLFKEESLGAKLAQKFLKRSCEIGQGLVTDGVAASIKDVDTVLMNGFYHLYGVESVLKWCSPILTKSKH